MAKSIPFALIMVLASGIIPLSNAQAASVSNPSFENPAQSPSGYTYINGFSNGWTFNSASGVARNGSAWGFTSAPDGVQVAFLQTAGIAGMVSQDITGLNIGTAYFISFYAAQRPGYGLNPVDVRLGGSPLGIYTPSSTNFQLFTTSSIVASASTMTLSFTGVGALGSDRDTGIDGVGIFAQQVPEPTALALMPFGLLGFARKKRAAS